MNDQTILGITPRLDRTGIAALRGPEVTWRGTVPASRESSDVDLRRSVCIETLGVVELLRPGLVVVEAVDASRPHPKPDYQIRTARLVGGIVGSLEAKGFRVVEVTRAEVERVLRTITDRGKERRLGALLGLALRNEHERAAALLALFGARVALRAEKVGSDG